MTATDGVGTLLDEQHPWPGLAAYDEASRQFFFGREAESAELLRLVTLTLLTVVYGRSGLGKSSLLQAGLFPALRAAAHLPVYVRIDFADPAGPSPGEQALRRLDEEVARARADMTVRESGLGAWEFLHRRDFEIWSADNHLLTPVFVFDQFEELFSRTSGRVDQVRAVFATLADLIENRIPSELRDQRERCATLDLMAQKYRILLAFREDFLPEFEIWKDQLPSLLRNRLRLLPMKRDAAIGAIERAGAAVLAPGVAPRVVDFVASRDDGALVPTQSVEPVLLSLCCTQLNRRRAPHGLIDAVLLAAAGQDILQSFYRDALEGLPERVPRFIETHLIQGDRWRGSYPRDEAIAGGAISVGELAQLTDRFRLLRVDQQADTARIELIHDRLVGVVRQARDERLARERETQQAIELERAEERSRDEAERRRQAEAAQTRLKRMRNALLGAGVLLVVAIILAVQAARDARRQAVAAQVSANQAVTQEEAAKKAAVLAHERAGEARNAEVDAQAARQLARSRELIAFALQQLDQDAELSVLLAAEAVKISDNNEALAMLQRALAASLVRRRFQASSAPLVSAQVLGDGRRVVSAGQDGVLRVWSIASGKQLASLKAPVAGLLVASDGRTIIAWSGTRGGAKPETVLTAWNGASSTPMWRLTLGYVSRVDAAACCQRLLAVEIEQAILVDSASGREIARHEINFKSSAGFVEGGKSWLTVGSSPVRTEGLSMFSPWRVTRWRSDTGDIAGEPIDWPGHYGNMYVNPYGLDFLGGSDATAESGNAYFEEPYWLLLPEKQVGVLAGSAHGKIGPHAFSPTDLRSVAVANGSLVQVWTAENREGVLRVRGQQQITHTSKVVDVAYFRSGNLLLSAGEDDDVRVTALENRGSTTVAVLHARGHRIVSARFGESGEVLTAGADGSARLWALPPPATDERGRAVTVPLCAACRTSVQWLAFATTRLTRTFTESEVKQYGLDAAR